MTKNRSTKRALLMSALSLLLCVSMLVGTTYAWFTDEVVSGMNTIMAGNLDVALLADGKEVGAETKLFDDVTLWEPGAVVYENLQVVNKGSLALQYQMALNFEDENELEGHKLSQVLKVAIIDQIETKDRATVLAAAKAAKAISLYDFFVAGSLEANAEAEEQGVVIFWEPGENDNLYNASNGKTTSNGKPLGITFGIKLVATQVVSEKDSFGNEYDENAGAEFFDGFQGGTVGVAVKTDDQGLTTAEVAQAGGDVAVRIPAGVKVKDGVSTLKLSVTSKDHADANVQLNENEEMRPLDVHIEGVAEGNTVPMLITLKHYLSTGINTGALRLYHVENGTPVAMTQVATPTAHNEFSYDPATGDLVLAMASFSEVAVAVDSTNPWDGKTLNYLWYDKDAKELTIYNADQLAGFASIVDGKAEGIAQDSFESKTVKLANNIYLSDQNFDPIGWGYDYDGYTPNGKTFNGTFDGNNHFIFDLYQNGWDLDPDKTDYSNYTYSMAGGGLFASVVDATIQNVKISGADIVFECVDMGVLVGYSQGNCTYKNIDIYNSKIANYQRATGGVVGEVTCRRDDNGNPVREENVHTFEGVRVHSDVVVGSLWGDFDALCGGVIGGRWDDDNTTKVVMKNVEVRCRMDVYNDITSAYQWHAYRRAGMLIGNTDLPYGENRLAQAPFLTCTDVDVYYGDWVNYTYCEFANHNPRYPWVRTQVGENCDAFSNPRWGVPNDANGKYVTDMNHAHQEGDECNVLRQFAQLYGGGQGVYGQHTHPGVTAKNYAYSITYMNDNKVLDIVYVTDNTKDVKTGSDQAQKIVVEWADKNIEGDYEFNNGWMNAGSTKVPTVLKGNDKDIVLYPYFNKPYTARFVDQQGNVIAWCFFHNEDVTKLGDTFNEAKSAVPKPGVDIILEKWEVRGTNTKDQTFTTTLDLDNTSWDSFKGYKDVTIYPVYKYDGNLRLTPVDEDKDGTTDYYIVEAVANLDDEVYVPGHVGSIPVKIVSDLTSNRWASNVKKIVINEGTETIEKGALAGTPNLKEVNLPSTLKSLGSNAFSSNVAGLAFKDITITYAGTMAEFKALAKSGWDEGLDDGAKVVCTDGVGTLKRVYYVFGSTYDWTWKAN